MKKLISIISFCLICFNLLSQSDLYPVHLTEITVFDDADFEIKAVKEAPASYSFTIAYTGKVTQDGVQKSDLKVEYSITPISETAFIKNFKSKMVQLLKMDGVKDSIGSYKEADLLSTNRAISDKIDKDIKNLLTYFKYGDLNVELHNNAPLAGKLSIEKDDVYAVRYDTDFIYEYKNFFKRSVSKSSFRGTKVWGEKNKKEQENKKEWKWNTNTKKDVKRKFYKQQFDNLVSKVKYIDSIKDKLNLDDRLTRLKEEKASLISKKKPFDEVWQAYQQFIARKDSFYNSQAFSDIDLKYKSKEEVINSSVLIGLSTYHTHLNRLKNELDSLQNLKVKLYIEMGVKSKWMSLVKSYKNNLGEFVNLKPRDPLVYYPFDSLKINEYFSDFLYDFNVFNDSIEIFNLRLKKTNKEISNTLYSLRKELVDVIKKSEFIKSEIKKIDILDVKIEVNEGYIENITVEADVLEPTAVIDHVSQELKIEYKKNGETLFFRNKLPFGFSRKKDFQRFKMDNYKYPLQAVDNDGVFYNLPLSFLTFKEENFVDRKDYSPKNQEVHLGKHNEYKMNLYKDETFKLFEVSVFSDFVGFDKVKPNGLVQIELSKKISLLTYRWRGFKFLTEKRGDWNFGFLSYVNPMFRWSKIENNNKVLELGKRDLIINGVYKPEVYSSTLELKRYESLSVGLDLNVFLFDLPLIKSEIHINGCFSFGRTSTVDSVKRYVDNQFENIRTGENIGANTMMFGPKIQWWVKADERYNVMFSYRPNWFYLLNDQITQVAYEPDYFNNGKEQKGVNLFHTLQFLGTVVLNRNQNRGKFFFRYTYNWQQSYFKTGYHQAQLGYSIFLLGRNKKISSVNTVSR